MSEASRPTCPHCGAPLTPLELPEVLFSYADDLACFQDDCPYFLRGWSWMERHFGVKASYRYRIDARTGHASPLAVRGPRPAASYDPAVAIPAAEAGESP